MDKGGFSLIELLIALAVIGILVGVLTPYTFRANNSAKESGVITAGKTIQTRLEMYASKQWEYPQYPVSLTALRSIRSIVSPELKNPFNGKSYMIDIMSDTSPFYLGAESLTIVPGVIVYETDGNSYTLTLYGSRNQPLLASPLIGGKR